MTGLSCAEAGPLAAGRHFDGTTYRRSRGNEHPQSDEGRATTCSSAARVSTFRYGLPTEPGLLPRKYVVTDTSTPARLSFTTVMSDWNVAPAAPDTRFVLTPPQGAKPITFLQA